LKVPYLIDIIEGEWSDIEAAYIPAELTEQIHKSSYPAYYWLGVHGGKMFIFPHPNRQDVWIIFRDMLSSDASAQEQAISLVGVLDQILSGLELGER
jgi:hypothetical protein